MQVSPPLAVPEALETENRKEETLFTPFLQLKSTLNAITGLDREQSPSCTYEHVEKLENVRFDPEQQIALFHEIFACQQVLQTRRQDIFRHLISNRAMRFLAVAYSISSTIVNEEIAEAFIPPKYIRFMASLGVSLDWLLKNRNEPIDIEALRQTSFGLENFLNYF